MKIDKTDLLYQNSFYVQRIKDIEEHFFKEVKKYYSDLTENVQININISLWKAEPKNGKQIAANKTIKYLVEIDITNEFPFSHIFQYKDALSFSFSSKKTGYFGENQIIYALIAAGIKKDDIYEHYIFYDDPEFVQTGCEYDIYVKSLNAVIEHHGTQHIKQTTYFVHNNTTAEKSFKDRQSYDLWKKDYCIKRNVRYIQFSIYDFTKTYMDLPVYRNVNEVLNALNLRTLSDDEFNKVIIDSKNIPSGINRERLILIWNSTRFVFTTQDDAAEILNIHEQTIKNWRKNKDKEFFFCNEYTTEDVIIPTGDVLKDIKKRLEERTSSTEQRKTTGCDFVAIYKNVNGIIQYELFNGYESCAESKSLPIEFRASKNVLKRLIPRNSSEVAIQYDLMIKHKNGCLFLKNDVFCKLTKTMSFEDLFKKSGKNITKGKMPKVVCYEKDNPEKYIVFDNAKEAERILDIKVSSTSIENACFYSNHKVANIEPWRFCFLCEYKDKGISLKYIQDEKKTNDINDIVLIWNGTPVAHGGIRPAERILGIYRSIINKQLKPDKTSLLKGICDFKKYTVEEYGVLPDFSVWNDLDKFKQEYQSK